jgi:hypothetical protein
VRECREEREWSGEVEKEWRDVVMNNGEVKRWDEMG